MSFVPENNEDSEVKEIIPEDIKPTMKTFEIQCSDSDSTSSELFSSPLPESKKPLTEHEQVVTTAGRWDTLEGKATIKPVETEEPGSKEREEDMGLSERSEHEEPGRKKEVVKLQDNKIVEKQGKEKTVGPQVKKETMEPQVKKETMEPQVKETVESQLPQDKESGKETPKPKSQEAQKR